MKTNQLYQQYSETIRKYLLKFVSESDADDLVQEVFIKVDNNLDKFRGGSSPKTWIYKIATNTARDFLKSRSYQLSKHQENITEEELITFDDANDKNNSQESNILTEEMNQCILEFIHRLPYEYSSVLVLSELEGYKNKEIAEILDISQNTAKVRLYRAKSRLKTELEEGCNISTTCDNKLECERKEPNK